MPDDRKGYEWRKLRTLADETGFDPETGLPTTHPDNLYYKIAGWVAKNPESFAPGPMIPVTEETLPIFKAALKEAEATGVTGDKLIDKAMAWLSTRYPRFARQAPVYGPTEYMGTARGTFTPRVPPRGPGGAQSPITKGIVRLNPPRIEESASMDPLKQAVQTLAHEMTHARQLTKLGERELNREAEEGVPYFERKVEKFARQGGATTRDSFLKFKRLLAAEPGAVEPASSSEGWSRDLIRRLSPGGRHVQDLLEGHGLRTQREGGKLFAYYEYSPKGTFAGAGKARIGTGLKGDWLDVTHWTGDQIADLLGYGESSAAPARTARPPAPAPTAPRPAPAPAPAPAAPPAPREIFRGSVESILKAHGVDTMQHGGKLFARSEFHTGSGFNREWVDVTNYTMSQLREFLGY